MAAWQDGVSPLAVLSSVGPHCVLCGRPCLIIDASSAGLSWKTRPIHAVPASMRCSRSITRAASRGAAAMDKRSPRLRYNIRNAKRRPSIPRGRRSIGSMCTAIPLAPHSRLLAAALGSWRGLPRYLGARHNPLSLWRSRSLISATLPPPSTQRCSTRGAGQRSAPGEYAAMRLRPDPRWSRRGNS